ncbi:hypothetical protein TTHERM_00348980 (macronuclear) [Tetrahymena thermophila SB210]|uniref:Uncharacterized protein n=1 Tax=Tetrahymena thermophila (strain SB210) TaxID=312017 RepID=I7MLP4_TETTS|nr:hypothetical protein TTHERM_00348980 [Tetrahymena thermophila SB210]EAS02808.1 hypothetical protein TTHERM_00348980 [Tetrahymena thermophila SB210]|eukprot:XP_001023053.1 hypothetical protein TTHERM_00348980 [Tetrahymena thermophila SB210]
MNQINDSTEILHDRPHQISDAYILETGEQKDAQQLSKLRKQLQDIYEQSEVNKSQSQIKQKGRSESLNNSYKKAQPLVEFQGFKSTQKKKKTCRVLQETGNNFYGPIQQTQVNQKISSIKDSIASAYLQKESSLSPFIQIYLKQALKLQSNPKKIKQQGLLVKNYTFESEESMSENNSENRDIQLADFPLKKSNFLTQTNNLVESEAGQQENNLQIQQQMDPNQKSYSPLKNKSQFIKDKLERMHSLSGDYLIEPGLKKVKENILNALNNQQNSIEDNTMEIIGEFSTSQEKLRNNLKKKYQRNNQRIKTATDEDFYSKGHPNNLSFYDNNNTKTHTRYTIDSNRLKTDISDQGNLKKQNNFWPTNTHDLQKKGNQVSEYNRVKSKDTDLTMQESFQEQVSRINKPQRAQSQGPKSGQAVQCIFYNADPNNTMLKDFFGEVDCINLNNIFVNQLGITDEQKNQMLEKMDPETKQQILRKFAVQDRIFKFSKFSNFHHDEFYDSFKNNYQFIQEEIQKNNYPVSCMHIRQLQKSVNSHVNTEQENNRSSSNQRKRVTISNKADPEILQRFQTPINLSRLVGHSRVRTETDVLADIGYLQTSKAKKENPLYINRINRVRLQSYSSSKAQRNENSSLEHHKQERINTASQEDNQNKNIKSFIDPRKVYRQNLEIYSQQNQNLKSLNTQFTEQYLAATQIKKQNQNEESKQKVFFQNQDLKRRLQISNLNINI